MSAIERIDTSRHSIAISRDLRMVTIANRRGPPVRTDGLSVGVADMTRDPPHQGEMHPDGDELICILSGRVTVTIDSSPHDSLELGPGEACIIPKGEWHRVHLLEPTRLLHITPGPNGDHRLPRPAADDSARRNK
jgi:mannose-6-phosphate isomerase-like protein (cupin superfamily)